MRKNCFLLFLSLLFLNLAFAQQGPGISIGPSQVLQLEKQGKIFSHKIQSVDTLTQYIQRAKSAVLYGNISGGYICGTSWFPDTLGNYLAITEETAQHFDSIGLATVTELLFWAAVADIGGVADSLTGKVYEAMFDTSGGTLLGTGKIAMTDVQASTSFSLTSIPLSIPATVQSDFLISLNYVDFDDTLGIVTSNSDSADGAGEKRLRQLASPIFGGGWRSMEEIWVGGLDIDAFIFPVVDDAFIAIDDPVGSSAFQLKGSYPNPASGSTTILYSLASASEISLEVFDLQGRIYLQSGKMSKEAGEHALKLDLSQFAAGSYYYRISDGHTSLISKLVLVK